jgi:hypothetical protein
LPANTKRFFRGGQLLPGGGTAPAGGVWVDIDDPFQHVRKQPVADGAMLQLSDGTSVQLADLAPTQGLAFVLRSPSSKPQMCRNPACVYGVECTLLHYSAAIQEQEDPIHACVDRAHVERVRGVLRTLWSEISRQFDDGTESEASVAALLKLFQDVCRQLAAVERRLTVLERGTNTTRRVSQIVDREKKVQ